MNECIVCLVSSPGSSSLFIFNSSNHPDAGKREVFCLPPALFRSSPSGTHTGRVASGKPDNCPEYYFDSSRVFESFATTCSLLCFSCHEHFRSYLTHLPLLCKALMPCPHFLDVLSCPVTGSSAGAKPGRPVWLCAPCGRQLTLPCRRPRCLACS